MERRSQVEATFWMQSYLRSSYSSDLNWKPSWTRAEELGIIVPDSVSMTVLSNGQPIERADGTVTYLREDSGVYPTMKKKWYLPKYDADGKAIDYGTLSVGYTPDQKKGEIGGEYVQTITQNGSNAITVNIYARIPGIGVVEMPATWNDDGNSAGVRPETLLATLLADGVLFGEAAVLKLDETGKVSTYPETWKYLQQRAADGHYIQYSIQFNDLPAYYETAVAESPVYSEENGYGDTLRVAKLNENTTFTLKKQTATATVYWEGDGIGSETELKNRPSAVNLKLEYTTDGGATWQPYWGTDMVAVTSSGNTNEWTYEWSTLPAVQTLAEENVMRRLATVIHMEDGEHAVPVARNMSDAQWLGENEAMKMGAASFEAARLKPRKLGLTIPASNELLADADTNFPTRMTNKPLTRLWGCCFKRSPSNSLWKEDQYDASLYAISRIYGGPGGSRRHSHAADCLP